MYVAPPALECRVGEGRITSRHERTKENTEQFQTENSGQVILNRVDSIFKEFWKCIYFDGIRFQG